MTARLSWTALLVHVLVAALARPAAAEDKVPAVVLVWGGGTTPEEGKVALARFEAQVKDWADMIESAAGYPRVVESARVEGLKPGFHVVLLGACTAEAAAPVLAAYKAIEPQVYPREVRVPAAELGCPKIMGERGGDEFPWKPVQVERKQMGRHQLTLAVFSGATQYRVIVTAADGKGMTTDRVSDEYGGAGPGCTDQSADKPTMLVETEGNGLRFQCECVSSTCTSFGYTRYWARFTVDPAGRIVEKSGDKVISKADCDQ